MHYHIIDVYPFSIMQRNGLSLFVFANDTLINIEKYQ